MKNIIKDANAENRDLDASEIRHEGDVRNPITMKQKMTAVDVRALVLLLRKKLVGLRYGLTIINKF